GGGIQLVKPDGARSEPHRGIAAVNVTENRSAAANGRRYRGRIHVIGGPAGMTLVNRVGLESYVAGVVGPEMGARRSNELAAVGGGGHTSAPCPTRTAADTTSVTSRRASAGAKSGTVPSCALYFRGPSPR